MKDLLTLGASAPLLALVGLAIAPPATAVDGVREISQACVAVGCFSGDAAGFPVEIDGSAGLSYRLTGDLQVPDANTTAIQVAAAHVSIDLNGFALLGVTSCSGSPISCSPTGSGRGVSVTSNSATDVEVRNGSIVGMGNSPLELTVGGRAIDLRVSENGGFFGLFLGAGSHVVRCHATRNGGRGINVGNHSVVVESIATNNGDKGIVAGGYALISRSVSNENGDGDPFHDGIACSTACSVQESTAANNTGAGLRIGGGGGYGGSVVYSNTAGTVIGGSDLGGNAVTP